MNEFITALCSNARNGRIPEEYDFFGGLIGEWDIIWDDHLEEAEPRRVKGEWIFSRVWMVWQYKTSLSFPLVRNAYETNNPMQNMERRFAFSTLRLWLGIYSTVVWERLSN